ncbi:DUF4267 domain-containing protein [Nocardia pseudobrasiliensis]|uniref:Uncharacterized protein DUF4267 n=1 Tax=Nocardia pseudobrasiliensis TaxID=45979 RepID=A0A370IGY1_9NOCA|nr:DUF4267 domain-containing protein [Nocardia pseudobrasiliensis]RDI68694.1 uncharacterized protein DUF4267 [Nocardia pseudobrasiliensis]
MSLTRINTALVLLGVAFILYIGLGYLIAPESMANGFGLPEWPHGQAMAFGNLKGVRDTGFAVLTLALLLARQRFALGIAMFATALVPIGDMITVLSYHGSHAAAFGIHGLTAALVVLTGALLVREQATLRSPSPNKTPISAAQSF